MSALLAHAAGIAFVACLLDPSWLSAQETTPRVTVGTQTVGMVAGPMFPIRILSGQSSKLFGGATAPSWTMTLTDPVDSSWFSGQVALGFELLGLGTSEPVSAYGIGATPKLVYSFTAFNSVRPYLEGGGGPMWTDLGGRVPEQPGQFNFVVWGGVGCAWFFTPQWAMHAGYRFVHISNGGTRSPNSGLNFGLPFIGLSYSLF